MKPRVVYVTHRVPWPPDRGDRIRTWHILNHLSRRADVDLACLSDERVPPGAYDALKAVTGRLAIVGHAGLKRWIRGGWSLLSGGTVTEGVFHSPELLERLRQWGRRTAWDGALASSSGVAQFIRREVIPSATRRWVDLIDVDSQKWLDYAAQSVLPKSLLYRIEGRRLRALEASLAESVDRLLVVSDAERDLLRTFCPTDRVVTAANGVDLQQFEPDSSVTPDSCSCVFVGVMDYRPNVDAVCWFADHVWPGLREQYPQASFQIVGRSPVAAVQALAARPGISVTGAVPDVRPFLHRATCVAIPLRIARGIQNKLLEAMACGCGIVCSSEPLKAVAVEPGVQLLQADTPSEWVQQIGRLFTESELRAELGAAAAATVRLQHRWDTCLDVLTEFTGRPVEWQRGAVEARS